MSLIELFPDSAAVERGELTIGGLAGTALAEEFGTPLVAYCERTLIGAACSPGPSSLALLGSSAPCCLRNYLMPC